MAPFSKRTALKVLFCVALAIVCGIYSYIFLKNSQGEKINIQSLMGLDKRIAVIPAEKTRNEPLPVLREMPYQEKNDSPTATPKPCPICPEIPVPVAVRAVEESKKKVVIVSRMPWMGERMNTPHSANCTDDSFLVIGALAAPTPRSLQARNTLRKTWFNFPNLKKTVTIRFLLAMNEHKKVPENLIEEADTNGDMIFLPTMEHYDNLAEKVRQFFLWSADNCAGMTYVLKTDDDSFVDVPKMIARLEGLPRNKVFFGFPMGGMPARENGQPKSDNVWNLPEWPPYMSGAGYVLSADLIELLAYPRVPMQLVKAEDVSTGLRLMPYEHQTISAERDFAPWGHCQDESILIHYQRDEALLHRRFDRAVKGQSICGKRFDDSNIICLTEDQTKTVRIKCPGSLLGSSTIKKILFASFGVPSGQCSEGWDGLVPGTCHVANSTKLVEAECLGKSECAIVGDVSFFKVDPCGGEYKFLRIVAQCG